MKRWLTCIGLALLAAASVGYASPAGAVEAEPVCVPVVQNTPSIVSVRTMPVTPNFAFTLDGTRYTTGADGKATLSTRVLCGVTERLVPDRKPVPMGHGERAVFSRWYGRGESQTATFVREYQVRLDYRDLQGRVVDPSTLDAVEIRSSLGVRQKLHGSAAPWLMGLRVIPSAVGLDLKQVYWTVNTVDVGGLNIINRSQFKFFPQNERNPRARLLFFAAKIRARDVFFGFPMGEQIKLEYPNGKLELHDLEGARITLNHLPRGEYQVTARGPGLRMSQPVAITRNQDVDLKILSYLDLAVVALAGLAFTVGLVLFGRRRTRRRKTRAPREAVGEAAVERTEVKEPTFVISLSAAEAAESTAETPAPVPTASAASRVAGGNPLRCPTCLSLLLEGGEKRCPSCGSRLGKSRRPIVLGKVRS